MTQHNKRVVCPESCHLVVGERPVVVTAKRPRRRHPNYSWGDRIYVLVSHMRILCQSRLSG